MQLPGRRQLTAILAVILFAKPLAVTAAEPEPLRLSWKENILTISCEQIPGREIQVNYLEAYCRPGSTDRDWSETTIGHATRLISADLNGRSLKLECRLKDGVVVSHEIESIADEVRFTLVARNPTDKESLAHWAQPCMRVDKFTGRSQQTYLEKSFVFLDDKLARMPTPNWATKARYVPGQVWSPKGVDRNDVNPRPLSPDVPSNGLIGCYSADESKILAMAWEPYQELFQGVIVCLHSDFRIGGLKPGETKHIRGRIYLAADAEELLSRYRKDFPEHLGR